MRSTDCGMRNSECGIERKGRSLPETSTHIPHSAFHIPHLLAGVMLLALATPPAAAQQPDSVPTDTLPPVVVTGVRLPAAPEMARDRKSTRLNSSHGYISYAVFCLKKKKQHRTSRRTW